MLSTLWEAHVRLHRWYQEFGRHHLPWRNTDNPYHIYISEVMLQQTQVQTVLDRFYAPFLARFPSLASVAEAPIEEVLKCWEGLGYYRRARNVHAVAQLAAPGLPETMDALMKLPGIGRNTASAISAFAFKHPLPIMEANVKRILYRLFALEKATDHELWRLAEMILDKDNPFDYNQAMMDIGSMICTPRNPACGTCPLQLLCQGKDYPQHYPIAVKKKAVPVKHKNIVVFSYRDTYYVTARTTQFLHGYYGFIEAEKGEEIIHFSGNSFPLEEASMLGGITQTYSHFKLIATVYQIELNSVTLDMPWKTMREIQKLPLSKSDSKVLNLLVKS